MLGAEAADPIARLIAICGLSLAALGTWIAVLAYRRDRPDLKLRWEVNDVVPILAVTVVNDGRRPTALASVRICDWRAPRWARWWRFARAFAWLIRRWRGDLDYGDLVLDPYEGPMEVHVLQPAETYGCTFDARRVMQLVEGRGEVWIVATDAVGNDIAETLPPRLIEILRMSLRGRD